MCLKLDLDENSKNEITKFIESWWVIISHHWNWNFSDYLPIFYILWDDALKKCIFYTAPHNLKMNKSLFPNYEFLWLKWWKKLKYTLNKNARNINDILDENTNDTQKNDKKFLFMFPSWWNPDEKKFKWAFRVTIEQLNQNINILCLSVDYPENMSYKNICSRLLHHEDIINVHITAKVAKCNEFKWMNWNNMRTVYEKYIK